MKNKDDKNKRVTKAVALQYLKLKEKASAPKVIAKGRGEDAQKIEKIARESGVPVIRDENSVDLFMSIKVGSEIPPELYKVAAEIIAYVYLLNKERRRDEDG